MTVVRMKCTVLWVVTPCGLVDNNSLTEKRTATICRVEEDACVMRMETAVSAEMFVIFYQTVRYHIPDCTHTGSTLHSDVSQ